MAAARSWDFALKGGFPTLRRALPFREG